MAGVSLVNGHIDEPKMTPQEAIEAIEIKQIQIEGNAIRVAKFFEGIAIAGEALEKQIPKKPIKIGEEYFSERGEWVADYECPICGNPYIDDSYCSCCGQALDWSDTE